MGILLGGKHFSFQRIFMKQDEITEQMFEGTTAIDVEKHQFKNIREARIWAKENITGTYHNTDTGTDIAVSKTAIDKYLSESAISKSVSFDAHLSALQTLPKLIETSVLTESQPDRDEDRNILEIQRLSGAINYSEKIYPVKITVKATLRDGNNAYSYEVIDIQTPEKGAGGRVNVSEETNTGPPDVEQFKP